MDFYKLQRIVTLFFFFMGLQTSLYAQQCEMDCNPVRNIGAVTEFHSTFLTPFLIFSLQSKKTNLFFELRGNYVRAYPVTQPPGTPFVNYKISTADVRALDGVGGVFILGYRAPISEDIAFMPYLRLQGFQNTVSAYSDIFGNKIESISYTAFLGGKLIIKVNDRFSMHVQDFIGPSKTHFKGYGAFWLAQGGTLSALENDVEFDLIFKITPRLEIRPYIQYITRVNHANQVALDKLININSLSTTSTVFAIRMEYSF